MVKVPSAAVLVAEKETVTVHVGRQGLLVNVAETPAGSAWVMTKPTDLVGEPLTVVAVIDDDSLVEP
jgi:hypothetical protein